MLCRWSVGLALCLSPAIHLAAQRGGDIGNGKATEKPISVADNQLVEENRYFRVLRQQVAAGAAFKINPHERDSVVLPLGTGVTLSTRAETGINLGNGEARFLAAGSTARIGNSGLGSVPLLVVELKQHWDAEVHFCSDTAKCTRPIRLGELLIGETTSLFTNGFITAYQHRLDRGGTLSSSYFTAKGKDHLLLIALTDLRATFDGTDEVLRAGQTYASEATGIEVTAANSPARWVVIRVETPKN